MTAGKEKILTALSAGILLLAMWSCASIGNPSGGPRDEDAPEPVRSNPAMNAVDFNGRRITIDFNELVNVKDAFSKVTVSPTSKETPRVSSQGKRVIVQFPDTLKKNTTYTVDFGNSIEDLNEGNKLGDFSFMFSTGPELDTLRISGVVLGARDLEPQQGVLVGIHSNLSDTAFAKLPLERITKTNDRGQFTIPGLKPGSYRVFALGDLNNDYRWDNPEESLAFYEVPVSPTTKAVTVTDSIKNKKTGETDSIVERPATRYLPDDILLNYFNSGYKPQYLKDYARPDSVRLTLGFNTRQASEPKVSVVGAPGMKNWYRLEKSQTNDTLTYWLTSRALIESDTLRLGVTYLKSNNNGLAELTTDTLRFITPKAKKTSRNKKKENKEEALNGKILDMTISGSSAHDVFNPIYIEFATPVDTLYAGRFRLEEKVDTLWKRVRTEVRPVVADTLNPRRYKFDYPWKYGGNYRLIADTIAAEGLYGGVTRPADMEIKVKDESDYSNLKLNLTGLPDSVPAFVEILNSGDNPVRRGKVENGSVVFINMNPGEYYARVVFDTNGNGEYDSGDYRLGVQPETVAYYDKRLNLKKNWDVEQTWDVFALPLDKQKPARLRKNKYDSERQRKDNDEENDGYDEEEPFDPTRNPFDPNDRGRRGNNRNNRNNNNRTHTEGTNQYV